MNIHIINGPNLNLLGKREPAIYGDASFEAYFEELKARFPDHGLHYYQSNVEGELINYMQSIGFEPVGIVLNAGAYSHTSIAIADAVAAISAPVVAIHISNTIARETYRHTDLIAAKCKGYIGGLGLKGYELGIRFLIEAP